MKMIFHLPFKPDNTRFSASQIRPYKMINAFEQLGYEVFVIMGTAKDRESQIRFLKNRLKNGENFDFLYSESSTMPTMLTEPHHLPTFPFLDFALFYYIRKKKIPIGLFYRDVHWKFSISKVNFFKKYISRLFYRLDLKLYNYLVDIIFLPTIEMKNYVPELNSKITLTLPPGSEIPKVNSNNQKVGGKLKILYVGGIGSLYNLELFLTCLTNKYHRNINFTLCTRMSDYELVEDIYHRFFEYDNIKLISAGGEDLQTLYDNHDMCCLFIKPTKYINISMPFKLFEYISYNKPIIAVNNTTIGNYVKEKKIGWAVDYNLRDLEILFKKITEKEFNYSDVLNNLSKEAIANTWESRANYVAISLESINKGDNS